MCEVQVNDTLAWYNTYSCERKGKYQVKVRIISSENANKLAMIDVCGQHRKMLDHGRSMLVSHNGQTYTVEATEMSEKAAAKIELDKLEEKAQSAHRYQNWQRERVGHGALRVLPDLIEALKDDDRFITLNTELCQLQRDTTAYEVAVAKMEEALAKYDAIEG